MLGDAEEWFYRGLGGIDIDISREKAAERITIRPQVVNGVDWVKTSYQSSLGMITTAWKREGTVVMLNVSVPVETTVVIDGTPRTIAAGSHRIEMSGRTN
jgi:alpha-L-rhamnosidase